MSQISEDATEHTLPGEPQFLYGLYGASVVSTGTDMYTDQRGRLLLNNIQVARAVVVPPRNEMNV